MQYTTLDLHSPQPLGIIHKLMKKVTLQVEPRKIFGKKLKALRNQGILPGNVYGKDVKSTPVQVPLKEFSEVYNEVGASGVVYLELDGQSRPVLIHNMAYDYVDHKPLHADFFQVNLKEKVKTNVPLIVVGEPKAVTEKLGLLLMQVSEVEVEALPTELPEHLEIDVTNLAEVGAQVTVGDIKTPEGVKILTSEEQIVASIGELVTKEAEKEAAAEAAAAEEAKAESAEGAEANAEEIKTETAESEKTEEPATPAES